MASDRFAGWIGQIYSEGRYEKGITRRSHKVGDNTFNEENLPVEGLPEYFEHFPLSPVLYQGGVGGWQGKWQRGSGLNESTGNNRNFGKHPGMKPAPVK
jgi:hypothetical protein